PPGITYQRPPPRAGSGSLRRPRLWRRPAAAGDRKWHNPPRQRRCRHSRRRHRGHARARDGARRHPPDAAIRRPVPCCRRAALPARRVTRVLVADDQAAVRAGFAALIAGEEDMEVAGEAGNGRQAVDIARRVLPHVVLMDIRMPVLDGLEATRLICADPTLTGTRVLVLTTFDLDEYVYAA